VDPEPGPNGRHQTSDRRIRLPRTLLPTVVVQDVGSPGDLTRPSRGARDSSVG
jgi:hypothetical protein